MDVLGVQLGIDRPWTKLRKALEKIVNADEKYDDSSSTRFLEFEQLEFVDGETYQTLMIRDCYDAIMEEMQVWSLDNDSTISRKSISNSKIRLTVLGTPGVGKSMMLLYLVYVFRRLGWIIKYKNHTVPNCTYVITSEGISIFDPFDRLIYGVKIVSNSQQIVSLFDTVVPEDDAHIVILATSPRQEALYNEFKKSSYHKLAYMPVWNRSEFSEFSMVCLGHPLEKRIEERINYFGGVPRRVFQPASDCESANEELEMLINNVPKPHKLMDCSGKYFRQPPAIFHDLVHIVPHGNFKRFIYRHASFFVTEMLFQKCKNDDTIDMGKAIEYARKHFQGVLAGNMFEVYSLEKLKNGGKFRMKDLKTGSFSTISLKESQLVLVKEFSSCFEGDEGIIFVSKRQNETAVDFLQKGRLMNATLNFKHGFIVNSFNVEWLSKLDKEVNWGICYVVPDELLNDYPEQTITPRRSDKRRKHRDDSIIKQTNEKIEKVVKTLKDMDQYAIGITLKALPTPACH